MTPASYLVNSLADTAPPPPPPGGPPAPQILVLRDAIAAANTHPNEANSITFAEHLLGGITLATALPSISVDLSIDGGTTMMGAPRVIVSREDGLAVPSFRIFAVTNNTFNLSNFALFNGRETDGGGIWVGANAAASLYNVTVTANSATGNGGGIWNAGTLTVENSVLGANEAGDNGGGIYNSGTAWVQWNTKIFNQNRATAGAGGGVYNASGATITITDTLIDNNVASTNGGGLLNWINATAHIQDCEITNNHAVGGTGGGIANAGQLDMTGGWIRWNWNNGSGGGGIGCVHGQSNTVLTSVHIRSNSASNNLATSTGGGFRIAGGTLTLDDCELFNNSADIAASNGGHVLNGATYNEIGFDPFDAVQNDN